MLNIIHTADWHLGHHLHGIARDYEHQQFLNWLLEHLKQSHTDALIVAGDIFDTANPSAAAQTQLYDFLVTARQQLPQLDIILIGGNHDSAARLDAPAALLKALGVSVIGGIHKQSNDEINWQRLIIPLHNADGKIQALCGAMPFLRHSDLPPPTQEQNSLEEGVKSQYSALIQALKNQAQDNQALLLTGHCYMVDGNLSELSERKILGGNQHALPVDIFSDEISYTALGHLHYPQSVGNQESIRYSGSPIPLSFDEQHYPHQVVQVTLQTDKTVSIEPILIPRRVEMLRIPNSNEFCALPIALQQLSELKFPIDLPTEQQPFLELRIALDKPEASLRQQVESALEDLPVRLLKISLCYAGKEQGIADSLPEQRLEDLQPEQVFQTCYHNKYATAAPENLLHLFHELHENLSGAD